MNHQKNANEPCCPKFNPEPWEEKTHVWQDKLFIRDEVRQLFHIPLNMGKIIPRMWEKIQKENAATSNEEFLMLAYDPSPWKSEIYMSVTKEVVDAVNVKLSGTYLSKVFDGPYNAVPKWIKEMDKFVIQKGKKVKKYYFYYTTCPKCAKIYGKNYTVAFADVE
ncbi:MAG: hypothetical protein NTX22_03315 [Ignavibacteriales bacterium]|nr:hypothetical protein [Ignavibacteriales bacterium]